MKKVLLYMALVFLVILLLLPIGLKTFGKNLYVKKEEASEKENSKEAQNAILKCIKGNETITTTYMKGVAYSFWYQIIGSAELDDNNESTKIIDGIKDYAKYSSNELNGVTDYKISFYIYGSSMPPELSDYSMPIDNQSSYYSNFGFVCLSSNL